MSGKTSVIFIGDCHFKISNIVRCEKMIKSILDYVDKILPDAVIFLGDLLNDHGVAYQQPFDLACKFLVKMSERCLTLLALGNHEMLNPGEFLTDKHFYFGLSKIPNLVIVDYPKKLKIGHHHFAVVPFVQPGRFMEALYKIFENDEEIKTMDCIVGHQEIRGAPMGPIVSESPDIWKADFPILVLGHIHMHCIVQNNAIYIGSPMQVSFTEEENKGIYHFIFEEDGTHTMTKLPIKIPVKRVFKLTAEELKKFKIPENVEAKIIVKCTPEDYRELDRAGVVARFKNLNTIVMHEDTTVKRSIEYVDHDRDFSSILFDKVKEDQELLQIFNDIFKSPSSSSPHSSSSSAPPQTPKVRKFTVASSESSGTSLTPNSSVLTAPKLAPTKKSISLSPSTSSSTSTSNKVPKEEENIPVVRFKVKKV